MPVYYQRATVQPKPPIVWARVTQDPATVEKLELLTSDGKTLGQEGGYLFDFPTEREIWRKNRCQKCTQRLKRWTPPSGDSKAWTNGMTFANDASEETLEMAKIAQSTTPRKQVCFFHTGRFNWGAYECCGGRFHSQGCSSEVDHTPADVGELRALWKFYKTPEPVHMQAAPHTYSDSPYGINGKQCGGKRFWKKLDLGTASTPAGQTDIRPAVALDCEMGTSITGESVLIKVSLIDFFTQEKLIDQLVAPTTHMAHYNTKYSSVTPSAMNEAKSRGTAIAGTDAARELVYRYVDASTIIIMHGGSSDLNALRMIHPAHRIIDTYVLESYDPMVKAQGWKRGLKEICQRRCGIEVQNAKLSTGRAAGHDSLEDALAAREIVCWWMDRIPDQ